MLSTVSSKTMARVDVSSLVKVDHVDVCLSTEVTLSGVFCKERCICALSLINEIAAVLSHQENGLQSREG